MNVFLSIIGIVATVIVGLGIYIIQVKRPKHFSGKLKPLERRLFEELRKNLPGPAQVILDEQIGGSVNGCRLYFEKSYSLEIYADKKNPFPRKDGSHLASTTFQLGTDHYKATFTTYVGTVNGLNVKPSPRSKLGKSDITFQKFKILNDPMEKLDLDVEAQFYGDSDQLPELLKGLSERYNLKNIQKALPEKQQQLFVKSASTLLPPDYLELASVTNGFELGDLTVYGLSDLEGVFVNESHFLKIVETPEGVLAIKQSKRSTKLVYFLYENEGTVEDMGQNFGQALDKLVKRYVK